MRAATAIGATAILILLTEVWARAAGAENAIKPGKWEFWTVGSKLPEPPPGTQLPPSMRWGPEGMIMSMCIGETNLPALHTHTPTDSTRLGKGSCDLDTTTDAAAATRSVSIACAYSSGTTSHMEGVIHFHDDTLDGTATSSFSQRNFPTREHSDLIKGRYVGPCDPQ
jgi:hypothetical protein